ncbi:hypothetical protein [Bacillus pinisoli]|uniref:hypothetical protein n=1 Tax=Bacillus pinisoli TaxID=2901866 RepID=UPI001FF3AD47|nr:hypothetical protein [Bacillus pinisoli]
MKKFMLSVLSALLLFSVATPAFANEDKDIEEALEMIGKTNIDIDKKIADGVEKADKLHVEYIEDFRVLEEQKEVVKLKEEKEKLSREARKARNDQRKIDRLQAQSTELDTLIEERQLEIERKIAEIQQNIYALTELLSTADGRVNDNMKTEAEKLLNRINEVAAHNAAIDEEIYEVTLKFTEELDKVITDVYNETIKMSNEVIKKAAEKGVIAECSWKLVRFADRWVWIDPVRVIKITRRN